MHRKQTSLSGKEGINIKDVIKQLFAPVVELNIPKGTSKTDAIKIVHKFTVRFVIASMALDWLAAIAVAGIIAYILTSIGFSMFSLASTWMLMSIITLLVYYTYASYENNRQATYDNVMLKLMTQHIEGDNNGENN